MRHLDLGNDVPVMGELGPASIVRRTLGRQARAGKCGHGSMVTASESLFECRRDIVLDTTGCRSTATCPGSCLSGPAASFGRRIPRQIARRAAIRLPSGNNDSRRARFVGDLRGGGVTAHAHAHRAPLHTFLGGSWRNTLLEQMHPVELIPDGTGQSLVSCPELAVELFSEGEIVGVIGRRQVEA